MARALWKGAISFGLVSIPVELHTAEDRKTFKFSMLDKRDLSPVGYKRYSKATGREVEWDDIVKGYEYEKDRYVVLSDEDFRRANVKASETIDILAFVATDEIAAGYYDTPYYLVPTAQGRKGYALLRETLRSTGRVAVAQFVMRSSQHLAAIVPGERALMLNTLRYQDELAGPVGIDLPAAGLKAAGVSTKEVELAKRLVDDMTEPWRPAEFKDSYHQDLMARIRQKIRQGRTKELTEPEKKRGDERKSAQIIDLAALLKQSLGKADSASKPHAAARSTTSRAAAPKATAATASKGAAAAPKATAARKRA
jgi:DNA end-binding protein Ku